MKIHLATNKQLETILRNDSSCPPSLLREVVEEGLNRGLFDRLIASSIRENINPEQMEIIHGIAFEDLMQVGRIGVFKEVSKYNPSKGMAFNSFLYMRLKNILTNYQATFLTQKRDRRKTYSYNKTNKAGEPFETLIADKITNVERYVVNKILVEQLLQRPNEHQRKIVLLRMKGYKLEEIAEILGASSCSTVSKSYQSALEKMRKGA